MTLSIDNSSVHISIVVNQLIVKNISRFTNPTRYEFSSHLFESHIGQETKSVYYCWYNFGSNVYLSSQFCLISIYYFFVFSTFADGFILSICRCYDVKFCEKKRRLSTITSDRTYPPPFAGQLVTQHRKIFKTMGLRSQL